MNLLDSQYLIPLLAYVVASIFIGFLGRHKRLGTIKATYLLLIISLLFTPPIGLIFLYFSKYPNPFEEEKKYLPKSYKCDNCGWKFNQKFEYCPHCNAKAIDEEL
jgi:hypothetical protein